MPTIAMRLYRRLARAFPHEFQIVYGTDVIQLGEDVVDDVYRQHGVFGLLRLIVDIAVRVPVEYLAEMRRDLAYAFRTLWKSRGFAAVGIISLGLNRRHGHLGDSILHNDPQGSSRRSRPGSPGDDRSRFLSIF